MAVAREALRLRARWVHELSARRRLDARRAARVAGPAAPHAPTSAACTSTTCADLVASLEAAGLAPAEDDTETPPLPATFRLAADGSVVPDLTAGGGEAIGVSPGRVTGIVTHDPDVGAGNVLVVPTLDPALAARLPEVRAIVAETGSPLSHLAILAREHQVPAVVNLAGAVAELHDGDQVLVDGAAGTVDVLDARSTSSRR